MKRLFARFGVLLATMLPDIWLLLAFLIPFAVYMLTLAPSVTFFDSGEFITATASLGSAHSPGYPLFLMYAKPFTWLPFGNMAFRVNIATAFSSSLACLGVYLLTIRLLMGEKLTENEEFNSFSIKTAGLAAACIFAFSPRLWLQSNHDKPYPLLAFVVAMILLLLLDWREKYLHNEDCPGYFYAVGFLCAMAMAIHQTVVLFVPAWLLMVLLTDWRIALRLREWTLAIAFALAGFAVQLYLPLRATRQPLLNWGDTQTVGNFLWHFLRHGYGDEPHVRDLLLLWEQLKAFNIPHEFGWLAVLLVAFAMVQMWSRHKTVVLGFIAAVLTFLIIIAGYFNTPREMIFLTEEFFTPLYLWTAVFIGAGLFYLLAIGVRKSALPDAYGIKIRCAVLAMFFALPAALYMANYHENNQHGNYIAFDYASNSLRLLPQDAVMFTWGDSGAFPLWYLQGVERMREDVDLPHTPHLIFNWYLDSMPRLFSNTRLRANDIKSGGAELGLHIAIGEQLEIRPVFMDFSTRYSINFSSIIPVQYGIVYRIRRSGEPGGLPETAVWDNYIVRGLFERMSFLDLDTEKAILIYANGYLETGESLMSAGLQQTGVMMLEKAEQVDSGMRVRVHQLLSRFGMER